MSTRLAIIDLDGVVADATARFAKAEEAKQAYLDEMRELEITDERGAVDAYWQAVFDPEHVHLDTVIEGAIDALAQLSLEGYDVVILTSRPESMREATRRWLFDQGYPVESAIIMKAPAFQYTKTITWKAGMVQTLAALYDANVVCFVDDEESNWTALKTQGPHAFELLRYGSLADASREVAES
jgi:hypothetical protein